MNLTFHNLTNKGTHLPVGVKSLLGLGLNFTPTPLDSVGHFQQKMNLATRELSLDIDTFLQQLQGKLPTSSTTYPRANKPKNLKRKLKLPDALETWCYNTKLQRYRFQSKRRDNLNDQQRKTLAQLQERKDLLVVPTDKNLGPAIINKDKYIRLTLDQLQSTPDAYEEVFDFKITFLHRSVISFRNRLIRTDRSLWSETLIIVYNIYETHVAKFYMLPKIHKVTKEGTWNGKLRPITSSVNTPTQGLSKWIDYKLKPYLQRYKMVLKDSNELLLNLSKLPINKNYKLTTLDATSLYTSISITNCLKIMDIILDPTPLKKLLLNALNLILKCNYFKFNNRTYRQTNGFAMAHFERDKLLTIQSFKDSIFLYNRFIDDLFIVSTCKMKELKTLLSDFSQVTWNIEQSSTEKVHFLDLEIFVKNGKLLTRTFQKPLNLHLYIPKRSNHSPSVAKGLIIGTYKKLQIQNSVQADFVKFFNLFTVRMIARGYPHNYLKKTVRELIKNSQKTSTFKFKSQTKSLFFKLPYVTHGLKANEIHRLLDTNKLVKMFDDRARVLVCWKRTPTLRDLLKSRLDCND